MAATISTALPRRSMSLDPIWGGFTSDLVVPEYAVVAIVPTSVPTASNDGETLTIEWGGNSLTFTFSTSPGSDPLKLPVGSVSDTIDDYLVVLGEALRQCEQLYSEFNVQEFLTANDIRLFYREAVELTITSSNTLTFATVSVTNSSAPLTQANLRLLTEVFTDTDSDITDESLGQQHSPYNASDSKTDVDFSHHFSGLRPVLPETASIDAFTFGTANAAIQHWYFRYADQYGSPPQALKMVKSPSYLTFYGSGSASAQRTWADQNLRHNYFRKDGQVFYKPIGHEQPDWAYFYNETGRDVDIAVIAYYVDGTQATFTGGSGITLEEKKLYWFASGPRQLTDYIPTLELKTASKEVYRYEFKVRLLSDTRITIFSVFYELDVECADWGMYLLMDNGLAGCETVRLRGLSSEGYEVAGEVFQKIRTKEFAVDDGDFDKTNLLAQTKWTANTGFYSDDYYLDHLRQLPLSSKAWLVDVVNGRFLKVLVNASTIEVVTQDDNDLFSLTFEISAGWFEQAANI